MQTVRKKRDTSSSSHHTHPHLHPHSKKIHPNSRVNANPSKYLSILANLQFDLKECVREKIRYLSHLTINTQIYLKKYTIYTIYSIFKGCMRIFQLTSKATQSDWCRCRRMKGQNDRMLLRRKI